MRKSTKHCAALLLIVIFLNSTICCPIYAESIFEKKDVYEDIIDDENTEDSVETTTKIEVSDSVESSSGILVEIIDEIKDVFNNENETEDSDKIKVEDVVVSDAALDFELDMSGITDEVKNLIENNNRYSKLSKYEKFLFMEQIGVREDTMLECEENGYSILESIPKALLMQRMCFNLNDALEMIQSHRSENEALSESKKYVLKSYDCAFMNDPEIFGELSALLRDGYNTEEVINSFVAAKVLNEDVSKIIKKVENTEVVDDQNISSLDIEKNNYDNDSKIFLAEKYSVEEDIINDYLSVNSISENELEAEFEKNAIVLGVLDEKDVSILSRDSISTLEDSSSEDDLMYDTSFNTGPINIDDVNMSVSKSTGSLYGSIEICNIPGISGLDLNLTLKYSSTKNKFNDIESRLKTENNWSLNIPFLMNGKGEMINSSNINHVNPEYITLGNGESYYFDKYERQADGTAKYSVSLCYNDKLELHSDINSIGGSSTDEKTKSKYKLLHKDGRYDYFNQDGQWLGTSDRFGNFIKLIRVDTYQYKIVDTKGDIVIINKNGSRISDIITPDNKTFTFNYDIRKIDTVNRKTLASIVDGENNKTVFTYEFLKDDNNKSKYYNALLTNMKLQSGIEYKYTYELGKIQPYFSDGENEKFYPRVASSSIYYDNVVHNQINYTYSSFNYTDANLMVLFNTTDYGYTTTESYNNGLKVNYTHDCFDRFEKVRADYTDDYTITMYYYDIYAYATPNPRQIITYTYNKNDDVINNVKENIAYTKAGDITSYNVMDNNDNILHGELHTYDINNYNLETEAVYKKNSDETITITNSLSNDRKTISSTTVTDQSGKTLEFTKFDYESNGQLKSKMEYLEYDPNKLDYYNVYRQTTYKYAKTNAPIEADPVEVKTCIKVNNDADETFKIGYSYDLMGRKIEEKNANSVIKYEYNGIGDITKESYCDKYGNSPITKIYTYNYTSNKCDIKDENGNVIVYDFDPAGKLSKVTQGTNTLASYTYDTRLRPATYKEGKAVTTYSYDDKDRLTSEVVKEGTKVLSNKTYTYENNATGLKTTEKINGDANSATVTNITQADILGRNTMVDEAGNITYYTYDMFNNVTKSQN